jgi:hypothetical protein
VTGPCAACGDSAACYATGDETLICRECLVVLLGRLGLGMIDGLAYEQCVARRAAAAFNHRTGRRFLRLTGAGGDLFGPVPR